MEYHVVRVILHNGRQFKQVAVRGGVIVQVRGFQDIPFSLADIHKSKVNYEKWTYSEKE